MHTHSSFQPVGNVGSGGSPPFSSTLSPAFVNTPPVVFDWAERLTLAPPPVRGCTCSTELCCHGSEGSCSSAVRGPSPTGMSSRREVPRLTSAGSPLTGAPEETDEENRESPRHGSSSLDPLLAPEFPEQEPCTATFPAGAKRDTDSESSGAESSPTPICKICFQGAEQGDLLNPCRCDGSVRYTHQLCLLKWISERGSWTCELCCYRYHVIAIRMKRPCQWQSITVTLVEKVQIIAVILGSLFLVSSVSWLLWSAFSPFALWQRKDILFQICYGMYGFMDLVCIGLILHEGAAVYKVFMRWRAVNIHWNVLNYDKAMDIEESSRAMSSAARTLWLPLTSLRSRTLVHPTQLSSPRFQCGYILIHLFNRIRPQHNSLENGNSGEVVMRVTSV